MGVGGKVITFYDLVKHGARFTCDLLNRGVWEGHAITFYDLVKHGARANTFV
jgi:hypothetical protein